MPTFLPFRSLMLRMGSWANSSKHPECTPANTVIGTPASKSIDERSAQKSRAKSISPRATICRDGQASWRRT